MSDLGPEANMIRDELRHSLVAIDAATVRLVNALASAQDFVHGERRPPQITRFQTPATSPGTHIRE